MRRAVAAGGLAVVLLAGCSADRIEIGPRPTATARADRPTSPESQTPVVAPDTARLAAIARDDGQPLMAAVLLREGTILMEPPPAKPHVNVTGASARAIALAQPGASDPASMVCRRGVLTDTELTDASGTLLYDLAPVWMCFWVNAIVGPNMTPRQHENLMTFIDANTGAFLFSTGDAI